MKAIMILIVTLALGTLSLFASTADIKSDFTVTQLALDAQNANEVSMPQMREEIAEDANESNKDTPKGDNTDHK